VVWIITLLLTIQYPSSYSVVIVCMIKITDLLMQEGYWQDNHIRHDEFSKNSVLGNEK
jgi:hypothetical protein